MRTPETPGSASETRSSNREKGIDYDRLVPTEARERSACIPSKETIDPDKLISPNMREGDVATGSQRLDSDALKMRSVELSGRKYYDDNGNVYRVGERLLPNKSYEINGYKYETDNKGRIKSAEGTLQLKDHEGRNGIADKATIDSMDKRAGDDRGHLIADRFNGGNGMENIVPMDGKLNKGDYRALEERLADAVKVGHDVKMKVEPKYGKDSSRPTGFKVTYSIDGEKTVRRFSNASSGGK